MNLSQFLHYLSILSYSGYGVVVLRQRGDYHMKAYLVLIVHLFSSCVFAMDPTWPTHQDSDGRGLPAMPTDSAVARRGDANHVIMSAAASSSVSSTNSGNAQEEAAGEQWQMDSSSPRSVHPGGSSASLRKQVERHGDSSTISEEASIARDLLEYDHRQRQVSRSVFVAQLERYAQQYPEGPAWSAAQARLGDMHREMAKKVPQKVQCSQLKEQAQRYYLSAFQHEAALPETKSWAAVQLGYICLYVSKYLEAKDYFEAGKKNIKPLFLPSLYNGLGVAHYCLGNQDLAGKYWTKVIRSGNQLEKGRAFHNAALLCADQQRYATAIQYLNESRRLGHPYQKEKFEWLVSNWKTSSLNSPDP